MQLSVRNERNLLYKTPAAENTLSDFTEVGGTDIKYM